MLPRKIITDTGLAVSALGLGTVKFGRNTGVKYPQAFAIPDDKTVLNLMEQAWQGGINLLDTAPAYGSSERRLGELLKQQAHDWLICTKAGEEFDADSGASQYDFSAEAIIRSVERSLKRLQRDVLDIVLIHSDGNDRQIIEQNGTLQTLNELKQRGLILATGMSTKTVEGGLLAVEQSDIVMVTHNLAYQDEQPVLDAAAKAGKAAFIKKALASGHLPTGTESADSVKASFEMIFANPAVASVIVGTINPAHLADNIAKACQVFEKN